MHVSHHSMMVGIAYFLLSGLLAEHFPFTRVPMYSAIGSNAVRHDAAVPLFFVNGRRSGVYAYREFHGEAPVEDILPDDRCRANGSCGALPCSMNYIPEHWVRWVRSHEVPAHPASPDEVEVTFGYLRLHELGYGRSQGSFMPVWEGTAHQDRR